MKKWFVIVFLCLGLFLVGNLGCGPPKYTAEQARAMWHDTWYNEGYNKGERDGIETTQKTINEVVDKAYNDGYEKGEKNGYDKKTCPIIAAPSYPKDPDWSGCCGPGGYLGTNMPQVPSSFPDQFYNPWPINNPYLNPLR